MSMTSRQVYQGFADKDKTAMRTKFPMGTAEDTEDDTTVSILQEQVLYEEEAPAETTSLDAENKIVIKANDRTIALLTKAITHVTTFDSLDTAKEIVSRAYYRCPSESNKRLIASASKSLKAAIKTDTWMRSKRRRQHVDEHTRKKNLDSFSERVAEAVASIQLDSDKRNKTLFTKIKQQYTSELPVFLKNGFTLCEAHIVAVLTHKPLEHRVSKRLEGGLYLLQNANVVGVNNQKYKGNASLRKAQAVAKHKGSTVYEMKLSRPSSNVDWYLMQDFGSGVTYAAFADTMSLDAENDGSYQSYVKQREEETIRAHQLKTQRLHAARMQFKEDNKLLYDDFAILLTRLTNIVAELDIMDENFTSLTVVSDTDPGLQIKQYRELEKHLQRYEEGLVKIGKDVLTARLETLEQRIAARTQYYERRDLGEEASLLRKKLKLILEELDMRRKRTAAVLGLVSMTKYTELHDQSA